MIAVIFELWPRADQRERYFELAAALHEDLKHVDGFLSVERFESVTQAGKYVSLSFWRDEAAVQAWRSQSGHRAAQKQGREHVFSDYRLRIATVTRDYGLNDRDQAPEDSNQQFGVAPER